MSLAEFLIFLCVLASQWMHWQRINLLRADVERLQAKLRLLEASRG